MKTKYLFSACQHEINAETLWVTVFVGSAAQDERDLRHVLSLAVSNSYYFEKVSSDSDDFLLKVADSVFGIGFSSMALILRCTMSIRRLRLLLDSENFYVYSSIFYQATENLRRMRYCANDIYHLAAETTNKAMHTANVKNLSLQNIAI